jgi:hypothetical protein
MGKYYLCMVLVVLVLLVGCEIKPAGPLPQKAEPKQEVPVKKTTTQQKGAPVAEEQINIPNDLKEILEKGKTRLTSFSYNYRGPGITQEYKIYVKGNKIKIEPPEIVNIKGGKFYNTIYLDTENKSAEAYCLGYPNCRLNTGKISDLKYDDAYIETPLDWLEKVTEAEKIDERTVEGRKAVYLETNIGKITVESYYGFLYKIEDGKKKWEFSDAALNSLKDSDVIAPE